MADYYALTGKPLPPALYGNNSEYSVRKLSEWERIAIEDYFFSNNTKLVLSVDASAVIVPQNQTASATLEDFAVLVEFAMGVLATSGFQPVTIVASLNGSSCTSAIQRSYSEPAVQPVFSKKLPKSAASNWVACLFAARKKTKDKLHITVDRFVRYLRIRDSRDALLELCICLESLIESQTEIAFRFSTCLAKVAETKNNEQASDDLSDLYDLRSKIVHGCDSTKEHKAVEPNVRRLHSTARAILTTYIFYLVDHTKDEWKKHLRSSLFK